MVKTVHSSRWCQPIRSLTACANNINKEYWLINYVRCNNTIYLQQHIFVSCYCKWFCSITFMSDPSRHSFESSCIVNRNRRKIEIFCLLNVQLFMRRFGSSDLLWIDLWLKRSKECLLLRVRIVHSTSMGLFDHSEYEWCVWRLKTSSLEMICWLLSSIGRTRVNILQTTKKLATPEIELWDWRFNLSQKQLAAVWFFPKNCF